jgi:hypothetical protein
MKIELTDGTPPPGCTNACHVSGRIQTEIFTQWFRHFIPVTKPAADDAVLLILGGHYSHTRNFNVITLARGNNVSILCLPPHSSHKMQPSYLAFVKPLKTYYSQEIESWLLNNFPHIVTISQVGKLFGNAHLRAVTVEMAVNGFRKSGIYPVNRNVFRTHHVAIHAEEEDANSEQSGYEPTMFRNKQRELSDFQLSKAGVYNGSIEAHHYSPINVSDEPVAFTSTRPTVSSSRLVLAASLSPLPSITKQVINDVGPSRAG